MNDIDLEITVSIDDYQFYINESIENYIDNNLKKMLIPHCKGVMEVFTLCSIIRRLKQSKN